MSELNWEAFKNVKRQIDAIAGAPPIFTELREVQPLPVFGQARTHRKRRINKKWRTRYGMKIVRYDYYLGDNIVVDQINRVAYCHPHVAAQIRILIRAENRYSGGRSFAAYPPGIDFIGFP